MKNKLNLFRQYAGGLVKFLFTITFLLTLCVGQMWGAGQYNMNWQGKVYFRAPNSWDLSTYTYTRLGVARTTSTNTDTYQAFFGQMTQISNTRLFYLSISADHSSWNQNEYIFFVTNNNSTYNSGSFKVNNSKYYTTPKDYGCNNSSNYYLFNPTSDANGPSVDASWNGTRNNLFKLTNTISVKVKKAGSSSYTTPTSTAEMPATTVGVTAYYLNGDNSSTSNTVSCSGSTYSTTFYGCPGGKITLSQTAKSGYTFDGYYVSSSAVTSPYYPTSGSAITIEARYTEVASTVSLAASPAGSGTFTIGGAAATSTKAGVTTTRSVTAVPGTGYNFSSWAITGGASISSTSTNPTTVTGGGAGTAATLTATFSPKTYSITLDGNGGSEGSATATYNSSTLTSVTHSTRASYDRDGYFTETSGGTKIINADGSLVSNVTGYTDASGNWIYDDDIVLHAQWTYNPTMYLLKFGARSGEMSYGQVTAINSSTSASLTTNTSYLAGTGVMATAVVDDEDYKFDSWYDAWTSGSEVSTDNPYSFTLDAATSVYAHFVRKTTSITLNKNNGSGGTAGPVTATHGNTTLSTSPLVNPSRSGYTFTGYWTESSGGVKVIDTDGYLVASVSGYTKSGNKKWNYDEPTLTLYAQWTENLTTVTINANPASSGTFTVGGAAFTPGNTTTAGVTTSRTVVATPASGKVFLDWSVSGNATGTNSTNTYTLKGNGSAGTGTLTANFGVASGWYMEGTAFGGWVRPNTATYQFARPYRGMENVFYYPASLAASSYWKVNDGTKPYSISNSTTAITKKTIYSLTEEWSNSTYASSAMTNIWVVLDKSNKKLWVQDPQTFHNVNVTGADNDKGPVKVTLKTTSAFTKGSNVFETTQFANGETFTVTVTPVSGYIPTITIGDNTPVTWWKEQDTYTASGTMSTSDVAVTISYTASYAVTFAKTTGCGTLTATGPDATISTGNKVKSGTSITFTQTATNAGYDFSKWYSTSTGTGGTDLGGNSSGLTKSITATTSVYPIYTMHTFTGGTLDKKEGSLDGSYSVTYLATSFASKTAPTRTGYNVEGYYIETARTNKVANADGTLIANKTYTNGSKQWTYTSSIPTLFTGWTAKTYTASNNIDKNGGDSDGKYTATYDATSITINTVPAKTGYTVEGYYLEPGCTNKVSTTAGALQASKGSLTDASNKWIYDDTDAKLYTKWTANNYTIAFNANDAQYVGTATGSTASVGATYDQNVTLTANGFSRTGYTFAGWATTPTGAVTYTNSQTVTKPNLTATQGATVTLYAKWTEIMRTVTVTTDGHGTITTPTAPATTVSAGIATGGSIAVSASTGYTFYNWTKTSGSGTVTFTNANANSTTVKATSDATVRANFVDTWNLKGDQWSSWAYQPMSATANDDEYSKTFTLTKGTKYQFKVVERTYNGSGVGTTDVWYGNKGSAGNKVFERGESSFTTGAGGMNNNLEVTADVTGTYTFTIDVSDETPVITVTYPEAYTITFGKGTGGSTITATASASGTLSSGNYVARGEDVTFTQTANTGYTFSNWYTTKDAGGSVVTGMGANDAVLENVTGNKTVYSRYTAHTYQLRFNKNDVGASGTMSNQSFTYDEASKAITSNAFYKDGYSFDYWTTNADGTGTQYTNGQSVRNLSSTNNDVIDLYAHWTEVTITDLTFEPASAAGSTTVTVTPVLSGTPTGTSSICWGLYYDALCTREVPGIEFSASPSAGAASVTFTSPAASGSYYVKATYRTGSACNAGTVLGEPRIEQYVVASKHDLTVKYMCGSTEITSRRMVEIPAASYTLVAPADVFGYTFSSWSAGDGVTITDPTDAEKEEAGLTGVANVKKVTANYDGTLTANYSKKSMILFKNTLNWNKVYVNVYTASKWGVKGAGNQDPNVTVRNQEMSLVPGTTDIYYYECSPTAAYVAFTDRSQDNYEFFSAGTSNPVKVSYPTKPDASGSEDTNYGFNAGTPMFVPLSGQTAQKWNNPGDGDHAAYSNKGYWRKYEPATGKTGYTLEIYNKTPDSSRDTVYTIPMVESTSDGDIFEATVILEANKTGDSKYGVKFRRDNGMRYTKTSGSFAKDGSYSVFTKSPDNYAAYGMETTVAGEYTFRITCANDGTLKMAVKYPASAGDYRLVYTDDVHSLAHPSEIVRKEANGSDIVSFFVREDQSPSIQMQSCSLDGSGNVSWSNYGDAINPASTYESVITEDGVYNFHLAMDEDGALSISKVEPYTGDFYIRTDAVGGTKWADFRNEAHKMKYSDYAAANKGFTHYFVNWVTQNSNVKFTVANDYSPCISDTLVADPTGNVIATIDGGGKMTSANANIRFMYNVKDNSIKRAYIAGAQDNGSHFLVLQGQNGYITDPSGNRLMSANSNNYGVESDATQLADNNEWLYKIRVKATPGGKVKLYARYNTVDQYFIGKAAVDDWSTADASEVLISGDGGAQNISVVYDYKTDRMIAAWEPADEINAALTLNADILIVREHQEPATNITFGDAAYSLTTDKTVYGVMRFYRNTLDNRDGDGNILPVSDQLPQRERYHYYISFPFDVNVSDIFGFGSYGVHWVLQYYDGKERAKNGLWADPGMTYWKYVPPTGKLNANEGYLLALSPSKMAYGNTADGQVWAKGKSVVELYFPDATMGATIKDDNVTIPALSSDYQCTIWRGEETGTHEGDRNYDRRIADSYWRCIGVPSFKDFNNDLTDGTSAFAWIDPAAYSTGDIHFLYEVQWTDYSLRAVSADNFDFKAMHAYIVQNSTAIVWNHVNAISHSSVVARHRNADEMDNIEFRLELQQNNELVDQTFVRLSDDEAVTTGFEFNHDMSKELYSTKANIYTLIGMEPVAANSLPISTQTTVVPVGIKIAADGDYTFSIPDGTEGIGITLIDNETGIRTSLSALDYTVNLGAGTYNERFVLEISPVQQTPTGIENSEVSHQHSDVRKVLIDGVLYIVKDGKMFDATGALVK